MAIEDVPSSPARRMKPMPRATLNSGYAVRALAELALAGRGEKLPVSEIARRQCILPRFLERIFRELRRSELLCSRRRRSPCSTWSRYWCSTPTKHGQNPQDRSLRMGSLV